jgi:hypothetical protein
MPALLATCNGGTIAGTHTPFKPAFLARQLTTSADIYLLASRRFLCESRFCRGGDQNNRSRQCTQENECAHDFLLTSAVTCKEGNSRKQQRQER